MQTINYWRVLENWRQNKEEESAVLLVSPGKKSDIQEAIFFTQAFLRVPDVIKSLLRPKCWKVAEMSLIHIRYIQDLLRFVGDATLFTTDRQRKSQSVPAV